MRSASRAVCANSPLYITILTVGYMVSRGLAKAGSRDPYWEDSGQNQARGDGDDRR
jgi:hypothetical protein